MSVTMCIFLSLKFWWLTFSKIVSLFDWQTSWGRFKLQCRRPMQSGGSALKENMLIRLCKFLGSFNISEELVRIWLPVVTVDNLSRSQTMLACTNSIICGHILMLEWWHSNTHIISMMQVNVALALGGNERSSMPEKTSVFHGSAVLKYTSNLQNQWPMNRCWNQRSVSVNFNGRIPIGSMKFDVNQDCTPVVSKSDIIVGQ